MFLRKDQGGEDSRRAHTPLPLPSPNKVMSQRPLTPNSPQVDSQNIGKYSNRSLVVSPKYATHEHSENRISTPKYRSLTGSQVFVSLFSYNVLRDLSHLPKRHHVYGVPIYPIFVPPEKFHILLLTTSSYQYM